MIYRAAEELLNILFPFKCPVCQKPTGKQGRKICPLCRPRLPYIGRLVCKKCGKKIDIQEQEYCFDCFANKHLFISGGGCFEYSGPIKSAMHEFKYKNRRELAALFAEELYKVQKERISRWKPDIIIPVPLYFAKQCRRGYNQAELLAKELSALTGIPVDCGWVKRTRNTRPLKELSNQERTKNLVNAFQVARNNPGYRRVLIIDDIYTTGSTIDAMAAKIAAQNTAEIFFLAVCIGNGF